MYQFTSRVRYSECNEKGILSYAALINYLQDCCTFQSEDLDIGLPYLREHHLGWFITSWDIKIHRMPAMGDEIVIATWPYAFRGFLGSRNFTITDKEGQVLVDADSLWILMDLKKASPSRLPDKMQQAFVLDPPLESNEKHTKCRPVASAERTGSFVVVPMHLDSNHHMNNGYYVEAALRELPPSYTIQQMKVEYKKSAVLGDEIICCRGRLEQGWQIVLESQSGEPFAIVEFRGE